MSVTIHLPGDMEKKLRARNPNLDAEGKEAMLIELYRQGKISRPELSQALGLERFATDALLKQHHVTEDLPTSDELEEDLRQLRRLVNR